MYAWCLAAAMSTFALAGEAYSQKTNNRVVRIRQLDVGQGDAALITTPEGKRILIDAGPAGTQLAALLRREKIDTIDLVIASHNHEDHIGGMYAVLRTSVVRAYVESGVRHTTSTYRRTMKAVEDEIGLQYLEPTERTITIGSVKVRILPPPLTDNSHNNNSVGVVVQFGDFDMLFTGDSEREELHYWLKETRVPRVEVLKAAHHGGWNAVSADWARATSPEVVLISVGARNGYGHPAVKTERLWRDAKARVYRTDRDGTIEVMARADGYFTVQTKVRR